MGRSPSFPKSSALALLAPLAALALQVPSGTELQVRLTTKVSTQTAKPKDAVEAVVIAPVMVDGAFLVPSGAVVRGTVAKAEQSAKGDQRSVLALSFSEIEIKGAKLPLSARVFAVDNARESVDELGQINGILSSETISGRIDSGIGKVAERFGGFAGVLGAVKGSVLKPAETTIAYDAGVEMTLKLNTALSVKAPSGPGAAEKLQPVAGEANLVALIAKEPFQTIAQSPPKPSDVTNLMLIGSEDQVKQTFAAAGWSLATGLNAQAKFETFKAMAEDRGYNEAPVSILMLDGKPPDMVFEKSNNTFEQRHHLRVWLRPARFQGKPVWAIAATHDTGISFSEANRTFIHKIDSEIDRERAKVVNDLLFTGRVQSLLLVDRPNVPQKGQNATGDNVETDARIAVMVLQ